MIGCDRGGAEQASLAGLSDKLTAVNQEMTLERQRLVAAEQQCALRVDEINSLHTRMQQTHEQHTNEVRVCVVVVVVVL